MVQVSRQKTQTSPRKTSSEINDEFLNKIAWLPYHIKYDIYIKSLGDLFMFVNLPSYEWLKKSCKELQNKTSLDDYNSNDYALRYTQTDMFKFYNNIRKNPVITYENLVKYNPEFNYKKAYDRLMDNKYISRELLEMVDPIHCHKARKSMAFVSKNKKNVIILNFVNQEHKVDAYNTVWMTELSLNKPIEISELKKIHRYINGWYFNHDEERTHITVLEKTKFDKIFTKNIKNKFPIIDNDKVNIYGYSKLYSNISDWTVRFSFMHNLQKNTEKLFKYERILYTV